MAFADVVEQGGHDIGRRVFHRLIQIGGQFVGHVAEDDRGQQMETGTHPFLGQSGVADAVGIRIEQTFDGVFKHLGQGWVQTVQLTVGQDITQLTVIIGIL